MFSMGLKSGEFGGQIISDSLTNSRDFKTAVVAFAACNVALSCMKTIVFSREKEDHPTMVQVPSSRTRNM